MASVLIESTAEIAQLPAASEEPVEWWLTPNRLTNFWEYVAEHVNYGADPKTQFAEDVEVLKAHFRDNAYTDLICIGSADGSRDPLMLVDEADRQGRSLGAITCIDIAPGFEELIREKLRPYQSRGMIGPFRFILSNGHTN